MSCFLLLAKSYDQIWGGCKPGPSFNLFHPPLSLKAAVQEVPGSTHVASVLFPVLLDIRIFSWLAGDILALFWVLFWGVFLRLPFT